MSPTAAPVAFHVMAKPTGARCNLRCDYCFFLKKRSLYPESSFCMSDEIMEKYIRQTIRAHKIPQVTIAWQGGEPTLMGVDFFKRAIAIEKKYLHSKMTIENTIQTNGVLIDEGWCEFLHDNKFLVGLSCDGPRTLHDQFRKDRKGNSVFDKVVHAVTLLKRFNVDFNILCTVNASNSLNPMDVYTFFRDQLGAMYLQFIPIVERDNVSGNQEGDTVTARSVNPLAYGRFLTTIFDEWIKRDVGKMFVQFFDGVLASYVRGISSLCVLQPSCGLGVALEHNGDIYSCDHYVEPAYLLGNIKEKSIEKLVGSQQQIDFGMAKRTLASECKQCEFLFTCYGECPKNRICNSCDGDGKVNYLCRGLDFFFRHTKDSMQRMAGLLNTGRPASDIMV